ncbi:MAG: hypothetical protein EOP93_15755 [Lysobacteraceae bacterium]|nr:MAG: hypothetical protein EOP93_15755 [Xanthomonadaceae bacterium]
MSQRFSRLIWPLQALCCLSAATAEPVPPGCERVAQASIATLTAPRYHQRVTGQGAQMELLRVDGRVWQRIGDEGWKLSKMGPAVFERAAHQAGSVLARCERTGTDRTDGVTTEVWRVTTRARDGEPPTVSQMWIGASDGRTYRNSGAGVESTVRYRGVEPPQ